METYDCATHDVCNPGPAISSALHRRWRNWGLRSSLWLALVLTALYCTGCVPVGEDEIVVATCWGDRECRALETEFARWSSSPEEALDQPTRIRWIRLAPGDDPALVADRLGAVDVLLGGLATSYERLAEAGHLAHPDVGSGPLWITAGRGAIGWAFNPSEIRKVAGGPPGDWRAALTTSFSGRLALGDPRYDPTTRTLAAALLQTDWATGYAALIRLAAQSRRIEPAGQSSLAAVERGRAILAPAVAGDLAAGSTLAWTPATGDLERIEGAAMIRGSAQPERSGAFLRFLASRHPQAATVSPAVSPRAMDLRDELLGAALVEAQDELWLAWAALERAGWPAKRVDDLLKAPPWPPASIEKMRAKESSTILLDTLAEQIAHDPYDRAWLLEFWERPPGRVDGAFLEELATVNGGRLGSNPRLRAWLRGEWVAWTRQNARRVTREAEKIQK